MKKLLLGLLLIASQSVLSDECIKTRAAFDIGSGSTKLKVAKVDTCNQKIAKILLEANREVGYKQALKENKKNRLSRKIINYGIIKLRELKSLAESYGAESYTAVATSAFRTAKNGKRAAKRISRKLGFKINIISQEKEAKIGFVGASVIAKKDLKDIVVWDIGGGSMQMTTYEGNEKYNIYKGKLASVSFKNHVIDEVQKHGDDRPKSPNPISLSDSELAQRDARIHAKNTVPDSIVKKLKSSETEIIGIGGVHYYSIGKKVTDNKVYDLNMVNNQISKSLSLTDEQLGGGKYVSTDITNLILVSGFMEELQIPQVKTGKINMADGLLIMPSLAE